MFFCNQNSASWIRITGLYGSQPSSVFFPGKTATFGSELQVSMDPRPHLSFCVSQPSSVVLCTHNSGIMTRINSLYGSQTSPVVLCKQRSMISTRITSLHGSQTSPVVLRMQNNVISIRNTSLYGSLPSYAVFASETATLGPELQVSLGPRPHLWFFQAKQRLLDQNYKFLWVPELTCHFVRAKQHD